MCGITGYYGVGGDKDKLSIMTKAISRRGPDDEGFYTAEKVGLGFRRLSIIDLSTGHQPLSNEDESVWVIFNGEIYDYQKTREELVRAGHIFKTTSDTEVIVHAYDEYGEDCFKKLDGMFAIALWDSKKSKLILARDRFGKKPLYWSVQKNTLWFASELKSLLEARVISKEIDLNSVAMYFRNDFIPTPNTIFKDVYKLEPASLLIYENSKVSKKKYWSFEEKENEKISEEDVLKQAREKIDRAVKKRLVSDVPLGLFLSGGLDSTIVAESAGRQNPGLEAFTLGFEETSYDETENAREIAKTFGLKHHVEILSEEKALSMLGETVNLLDEPLADASILPQLLLSQFTKKYVTVALSGDGGDELLVGYQHIQAHRVVEKLKFIPSSILNLASYLVKKIPSGNGYFSLGFKAQRFSRGLSVKDKYERDLAWRGAFGPSDIKKLFTVDALAKMNLGASKEILKNYSKEISKPDSWLAWSYVYLRTFLMDDVMVKVDRATMWYGLESRAPLLDTDVVTFLLNLPEKFKLGSWKKKELFKKLLKGKVSDKILNAEKHGFGVPVSKWLKGPLYEKLLEVSGKEFLKEQNIFNSETIIEMINSHKNNTQDRRKELWAYLMFQLWYTRWVK